MRMTYLQPYTQKSLYCIKELVILPLNNNQKKFSLSTTPFYCGVLGHEDSWIDPSCGKYGVRTWLNNPQHYFYIMPSYYRRTKLILDLHLREKIQETVLQSLIKDIKQCDQDVLGMREALKSTTNSMITV